MSKIIVDQIQAPNSPAIDVPATSADKYIEHTTSGTFADFSEPRNRKKLYNYADTETGVSHVDFSLYDGTKKIVSMKLHGSYPLNALDTSVGTTGVFRMDLLNSSDATVITAGSVTIQTNKRYSTSDTYNDQLTSQNNFGIYCHDTPSTVLYLFEGDIVFASDDSSFYANFRQVCRNVNSVAHLLSGSGGTLTAYPDKIRFYFDSSNSLGSKIIVTPTYEP